MAARPRCSNTRLNTITQTQEEEDHNKHEEENNNQELIPEITISDHLWNKYINDVGCVLDDPSTSILYKADDGRKYKQLWKLSNYIGGRMDIYRERFLRLPKSNSKTDTIKRIGKIIYIERILFYIKFPLDQSSLHMKLKVAYGLPNETTQIIMILQEYSAYYLILTLKQKELCCWVCRQLEEKLWTIHRTI